MTERQFESGLNGGAENAAYPLHSTTGRLAYVPNAGSGDVTTFAINLTTGGLTEVGSEVATGATPSSITALGGSR